MSTLNKENDANWQPTEAVVAVVVKTLSQAHTDVTGTRMSLGLALTQAREVVAALRLRGYDL